MRPTDLPAMSLDTTVCRCDRCEGRGPEWTEPQVLLQPKDDLCFECDAVLDDAVSLLCPDCEEDEERL